MGLVMFLIIISVSVGVFSGSSERGTEFYINNFQKYLTPIFMKVFVERKQKRIEERALKMLEPLNNLNKK